MPQVAGRQPFHPFTAVASLRNPPRSRPVARRPFLLRLHRPKFKQRQVAFVTGTVRVGVRTRVGVLVHGQPTGAHLILRVLFVVLRNVVVRGGDPTRPSLPTHDGQISVEVSDREKLRHTEAAIRASTAQNETWAAATCASRAASISVSAASSSRAGLLNQIDSVERGSSRGAADTSIASSATLCPVPEGGPVSPRTLLAAPRSS